LSDDTELIEYRVASLESKIEAHLKDCAEYRKENGKRYFYLMMVLVGTLTGVITNLIMMLVRS